MHKDSPFRKVYINFLKASKNVDKPHLSTQSNELNT